MQARNRSFLLALLVLVLVGAGGVTLAMVWTSGDRPDAGAPPTARAERDPATDPGAVLSAAEQPEGAGSTAEPGRQEVRTDAAPGDHKITLSGRLVIGGRPVADTVVRYAGTFLVGELSADPFGGPRHGGDEQRTDADGRFRFVVAAKKAGRLALGGDDYVFDGLEHDTLAVSPSARDRDLGDIELAPAAQLAGHVRDMAGKPLAGVEVALSESSGVHSLPGFGRRREQTDADGRFAFGGLRGAAYRVTTASPLHLPRTEVLEVAAGVRREDVVLTLVPGASIWGRVVDDLGRPVVAATVGSYRRRTVGEGVTIRGLSQSESAETDANGRFHLGGIADEEVTLRARAQGHGSVSQAGVRQGTGDLLLTLPRNGAIEGVVVDTAGAPIAGTEVRARPADQVGLMRRFRGATTTGDDGAYRIDDVAAGEVVVDAEGDDHVSVSRKSTVQPGQTTKNVVLEAARGATVMALVVDAKGAPVEDALVEVVQESENVAHGGGSFRLRGRATRSARSGGEEMFVHGVDPGVLGSARTDAEGRAVIKGLPAGQATARATHDEHAASTGAPLTLPSSGTAEAVLALRAGGAALLRAVDADGAPVVGAMVVLAGPEGTGEASEDHTAKTDPEGHATIRGLPAGTYSAVLQAPMRPVNFGGGSFVVGGHRQMLEDSRTSIAVRAGETVEATIVRPLLATVMGSLRDASGAVAGGKIEVSPEGGPVGLPMGGYSATTDDDGRYRIEGVPPGEYTMTYGRKGQAVLAREPLAIAGEREIERHLQLSGGIVTVRVLDADGQPLEGAKVTMRSAGAKGAQRGAMLAFVNVTATGHDEQTMELGVGRPSVRTDENGLATMPDVPPGEYTVVIAHELHLEKRLSEVEVRAEATNDLGAVAMQVAGGLRGTVVDAEGSSPMVASVEAERADGESGSTRKATAVQGSFQLKSLAPGRYRVRARGLGPGGQQEWGPFEEVTVAAGRTASVKLRL